MRLLTTLRVLSSVIAEFASHIHVQIIEDKFVTLPPYPTAKLPAPDFVFKLCETRDGVSGIKFGARDAAD
ncbi:hypothetical protein BTUL_0217g00030 [Botrytis tulipae]|uniref:Uncharacterized protein n=1 Tax=Botrytis tulipae TaxID=87230 RepID=A0A4Z1EAM5_9HELO|nr:hypothetical protein BTUL_0217g00030 [Botrytis tulipae]